MHHLAANRLGLALAALGLAVAGQSLLYHQLSLAWGLALFGAAVALFAIPAPDGDSPHLRLGGLLPFRVDRQRAVLLVAAGVSALASLLLFSLSLWAFAQDVDSPWGWPPFLVSLAGLAAAAHFLGRSQVGPEPTPEETGRGWGSATALVWLALLLVLGLALFLRLYRADSLPFGLWVDEAIHGLRAIDILHNPSYRPVYIPGTIATPSPFVYLQSISVEFLGRNLAALRLPAAMLGTLTVWLFFLLARDLFNWKVALAGAFLMAVSFWHALWGRSGMPMSTAPLVAVLAVLLLVRSLRHGRITDYAWAGLALGATAWSYSAMRLFPLVVAAFLLYLLVTRRGLARSSYLGLGVYAVAALLAAGPILEYMSLHPGEFWARANQVSVFREDNPPAQALLDIGENAKRHLLMFNYEGDHNGRHNLPEAPMLDFGVGILAVLGLGYTLRRLDRPLDLLLALWFLVMLVPGVLSLEFEAPQSLRAVGTLPVVYLFALAALHRLWTLWEGAMPQPGRLAGLAVLLAGLAVVGYLNYTQYFRDYAESRRAWEEFFPRETYVAYHIHGLPDPDTAIYTTSAWNFYFIQAFLDPGGAAPKVIESPQDLPIASGPPRARLFIDPRWAEVWQRAQECYPLARVDRFPAPDGGEPPLLFVLDLDGESIRAGAVRCGTG